MSDYDPFDPDRLAWHRTVADLLLRPGVQLLHTHASTWNQAQADVILAIRLTRAMGYSDADWHEQPLVNVLFAITEDERERGIALLEKLGAFATLKSLRFLYVSLFRMLARAGTDALTLTYEEDQFRWFRLSARGGGGGLRTELGRYVQQHATQLQVPADPQIEVQPHTFQNVTRQAEQDSTLLGGVAGPFYRAIIDNPPNELAQIVTRLPGAKRYGARLIATMRPNGVETKMSATDLDELARQVEWALVDTGSMLPTFVTTRVSLFEWFLQQLLGTGGTLLSAHRQIDSLNHTGLGVLFCESECIGHPAWIAAQFEQCMPWMQISVDSNDNFWWFENSAEWDSYLRIGDSYFCKPRSEAALLAAFSRTSHDDCVCFGALSGKVSVARLKSVPMGLWGMKKNRAIAAFAPWVYNHQWGGGSSEHFSIFYGAQAALSEQVAQWAALDSTVTRF